MSTYSEKLRDPRWQKMRLEALQDAGWECHNCGDNKETLHVHHKRYVKGRAPWEYELNDLSVLCETCHELEHADRALLDELLAQVAPGALPEVVGLVAGYFNADMRLEEPGLVEQARQSSPLAFGVGTAASVLSNDRARPDYKTLVKDYVRQHKGTPAVRGVVETWDDEDEENKG